MQKMRLLAFSLGILAALPALASAQPLCLSHSSLDWLVLDSAVVVRAKLLELAPVDGHAKLRELRCRVLETVRGAEVRGLRIPIELDQEQHWAQRLVPSRSEVLLFLDPQPRGYQQPRVRQVIRRYRPSLFYVAHIELERPHTVYNAALERLKSRETILSTAREIAARAGEKQPPRFQFRLLNNDSLIVPLNRRMEGIANTWAGSNDRVKRGYGQIVLAGFKRHRNRPFEGGYWHAALKGPGGSVRFGLRLDKNREGKFYALVVNGSETIRVDDVTVTKDRLRIEFPHYNSAISAQIDARRTRMTGTWRKLSERDKWTELPFVATMTGDRRDDATARMYSFIGRWSARFSQTPDPAVVEIDTADRGHDDHQDIRQFKGTVLTTTGDYRYLAGDIIDSNLELSAFDGAHAFLLRAIPDGKTKLRGGFWSRDTWQETWTAKRDPKASLPDAFAQTRWTGEAKLDALRFPNLDGKPMSLADPKFAGKVRIITVFGSWCPNCHDSALYLVALHRKYASKGLAIVGLAFELTGEFDEDARQVRRYVKRHATPYPVLVAGLADKEEASRRLPILDRVRAYPTTIFLNAKNEVITIHTGFSGPATGKAFEQLKARFEAIIQKQLGL